MCCFGMTKLLAIKLVGEAPSLLSVNEWILGEAPSLLSVNEWISGFRSVLLNYGKDKSDSKTVCKSPLMRTWRAGLKTGFFSWLMLVVVWVLNDDLPSVLLFDTLGSFSVCVSAAAMLIAVVFSYLRRDLVGLPSSEWLRPAGSIASSVSLPWLDSPVFHFLVVSKGKLKKERMIGKPLLVCVPSSIFPFR